MSKYKPQPQFLAVTNFPICCGWLGQNSCKKTQAPATHPAPAEMRPAFPGGGNWFKSFDTVDNNKSRIKAHPNTDLLQSQGGHNES